MRRWGAALGAVLALAGAARAAPAGAPQGEPILAYLDQAIGWYRQQAAQAQLATEPTDVVFASAARQQARQALQLAFAFARAAAALQPQQAAGEGGAAPAGAGKASLAALAAEAAQRAARGQAEVEALQRRAAAAPARERPLLAAQLAEARSELALAEARRDALSGLAAFAARTGAAGGGLAGQIDALQRSVPEVAGDAAAPQPPPQPAVAAAAVARRAAPNGILALTSDLLALGRKLAQLRDGAALTAELRGAVDRLRAPLAADLRATLQRGDQLAEAPDTADRAALVERARDVEQLTAHFKLVSAAVVPLAKQAALLDTHAATLSDWHSSVEAQDGAELRALLVHLAVLGLAIGVILAASAFWRHATLRYVRDPRRRQQSLLLRRILVTAAVLVITLFSFVTELGSLATFAGFITAGLAVALQNVILSVAAYFLLIGRYGIRVGDRVQITGVTGDVIDVGLVRLHLMELGADGLPTGRVVAFSNAVLFQPGANFFKQLPGSNFGWHEITLTLSPDTDYRHAERRLLGAVERVYAQYGERIARAHAEMAENLTIPVREPAPQSRLRLTEAGLEMTIRYPAPLESAAAIHDQVARALLEAVEAEPRLKLVGSGTPTIQAGAPAPASG